MPDVPALGRAAASDHSQLRQARDYRVHNRKDELRPSWEVPVDADADREAGRRSLRTMEGSRMTRLERLHQPSIRAVSDEQRREMAETPGWFADMMQGAFRCGISAIRIEHPDAPIATIALSELVIDPKAMGVEV